MIAMETDILTQVMRLRNRGLAVFPVDIATKKPLVEWGGMDAVLPSEDQVRLWFGGVERAVGVACGPVSDIILLDLDFKKHPEAWAWYEANRHRIPRTWKEETGSGGWHFYFRWAAALNLKQTNTTSKLNLGVDTKGFGGYSKITPSPGYKWLIPPHIAPLAMCPQWLIDALPTKDKREIADAFVQKPEDWMIKELESVDPQHPVNGRTPTFVRAINRLKAKGLSPVEITALLGGYAEKYAYPDLGSLVHDQFRRYPPRPMPTQAASDEAISNHSLKSFLQDIRPHEYIVPGILAVNTINIMAGLQESRKSWLMLDLAVGVASGTSWMGRYPCERRKVMIFDQERPKLEMQRRIHSLLLARGLTIDDLEGNLVPKVGTTFRVNLDASFQALRNLISTVRPDVVLIDSLKTFQTGDVKQDRDMQLVFERFKELRQEYGLTFVILHHENKGAFEAIREKHAVTAEKVAGSAVINEVPEGIFIIRNYDGDSSLFHHNKNSYGTKVAPFMVKVRDVTPDKSQIAVEAY